MPGLVTPSLSYNDVIAHFRCAMRHAQSSKNQLSAVLSARTICEKVAAVRNSDYQMTKIGEKGPSRYVCKKSLWPS